jgi:hypothetical protein
MTIALPPPIAAYYDAKNRHDIDGMLAPFAVDALVHDEGHDHLGRASIRAWMEDTTRKYRVTSTPEESSADGAELVVRALVSGNFPGSPAHLTYRFALADDRIARLTIG